MLMPGRYVAEHDGDYLSRYRIVMDVRETEDSYIFKLLEYDNRYSYDHIEAMFKGKKRKTIRKDKSSGHAMRVWGDDSFTIYPFQAGIPFYFKREE